MKNWSRERKMEAKPTLIAGIFLALCLGVTCGSYPITGKRFAAARLALTQGR